MYDKIYFFLISRVPSEIPHKISYPYIERCVFYSAMKMWELLDLRAHKCFWNGPQAVTKIPAGHPNYCIHCDSITTGQIRTISISMEPSWPIGFWWFAFTNQRHRWGTRKVGICTIMKYLLVQYKHNLTGMIFLLHQQWYVCEWGKILPWPCQPVFISQKVYEPLMEILWKYLSLSFWFE